MNSIKLFESKNIRSVWDDAAEKWYFSVQDVVSVLTDTVDVKDYIKKIKKRDLQLNSNWGTICPLVEMEAVDKGREQRPTISKNPLKNKNETKMNYIYSRSTNWSLDSKNCAKPTAFVDLASNNEADI